MEYSVPGKLSDEKFWDMVNAVGSGNRGSKDTFLLGLEGRDIEALEVFQRASQLVTNPEWLFAQDSQSTQRTALIRFMKEVHASTPKEFRRRITGSDEPAIHP